MCMTPGCGSIQHKAVGAYSPKGTNAKNPFYSHGNRNNATKMNHSAAAKAFYGQPTIKVQGLKIGKY